MRKIRAAYNDSTIRVYQAYSEQIADAALRAGKFVSPFKLSRMTWIKPSFLWMMYRCGYSYKDEGLARVLAIDITREGFEWALANACISHFETPTYENHEQWQQRKAVTEVRIQWDPERDLNHNALAHCSIQIGLTGAAVKKYVQQWCVGIEDVTEQARAIKSLVDQGELAEAAKLLPEEREYPVPDHIRPLCGMFADSHKVTDC